MIAQYGDGCMIIFGHPRMHEDDAERSIRAGQQMIREIAQTGPFAGEYLQSRVAVATGRVVIGDLTGASQPDALAGETPNLAARLQGTIDPQELIIDERTMRMVSHAFELSPKGAQVIRGFDKPVEGWIVGAALETRSRYDMLAPTSMHDIVGREAEMDLLWSRWQRALQGESQVVVLQGEPGIGKSWLISSFANRAMSETPGVRRLRLFCSELHANTALHPVMDQISWAAGVRTSDDAGRIKMRLDRYFAQLPDTPHGAAELVAANILGANAGQNADLNAAQQKVATFRMLHQLLALEAANGPVLLEFEDAHWADPTSLELLAQLANVAGEAAPQGRILIVVTHRPEFQLNWPDHPWVATHSIERLSPADCADLAKTITSTALPEARLREIVAKADGVPLFVREITRAISDAEHDNVGGALDVPDTLESSLMARLDRLNGGKHVVQVAATLGRLFHERTLAEVSGLDREALQSALAQLVDAEVITPLPDVGAGAYLFRHALIQDAAYSSLLRRERREIHGRAAEVLAGDQATAQIAPEILARHYAGAEMPLQAVGKLIEAGRDATARAAQIEANNHFRTALDLLSDAGDDPAALGLEAAVNALLGQSLIATLGFGAPEIAASFARARELSEQTGDFGLLLSSMYGMWTVAAARGERDKTMALAAEATQMFGQSDVPLVALAAAFMDGVTHLYLAEMDTAQAGLEKAIALYDPAMYPHMMQAFGDDIGTFAMIYLQWIKSLRGDFAGAAALTAQLNEISASLDDRQIDTRNLGFATSGAQSVGAVEMAIQMADQLTQVATERCYPHWIAVAQINRGWGMCQQPGGDAGIDEINAGLAFFNLIGQRTPLSLCHTVLVESYLQLGRNEEALEVVNTALESCDTYLDRVYAIDLQRLRAQCLIPSDPDAAEAGIRAALAEAEAAGMYYFALKAATVLATLLQGGPKAGEAKSKLADVLGQITTPMPLPLTVVAEQLVEAS